MAPALLLPPQVFPGSSPNSKPALPRPYCLVSLSDRRAAHGSGQGVPSFSSQCQGQGPVWLPPLSPTKELPAWGRQLWLPWSTWG